MRIHKVIDMPHNCPICNRETTPERALRGSMRVTEQVCESCDIAWHIDTDKRLRIAVSSTHSRASKLNDDDFEKLLKRIADYERS